MPTAFTSLPSCPPAPLFVPVSFQSSPPAIIGLASRATRCASLFRSPRRPPSSLYRVPGRDAVRFRIAHLTGPCTLNVARAAVLGSLGPAPAPHLMRSPRAPRGLAALTSCTPRRTESIRSSLLRFVRRVTLSAFASLTGCGVVQSQHRPHRYHRLSRSNSHAALQLLAHAPGTDVSLGLA